MHRARQVGFEAAHRKLATLKCYRVAPWVETIEPNRSQAREQPARIAIHDLVRLEPRYVFLQQRGATRQYQREPEPSLARADDASSREPPIRADSAAFRTARI